uniref:Major facilitator superfamily (MFS) profile domain-containing protein n=1 Tax=Clastoptera arizonana TaxID=38151 RepID=A0A1B6C688_9HEMI
MVLAKVDYQGKGVFRQYMVALLGTINMAIVGCATGWPSPILIKMKDKETPFSLDTTEVSWMVSLMFLGTMFSPIPTAYLTDRFGRKRIMMMMTGLPFVSWILIYFAASPLHLYIARFLAGLWAGVSQTAMPVYIAEIAQPHIRGSLSTFLNLQLNSGVLASYVIGPYVSYHVLAAIFAVMTTLYFCVFLIMPESPYYYMMHNKKDKAFKSLSWLRGDVSGDKIETELSDIQEGIQQQMQRKGGFVEVFRDRGNRRGFLISQVYAVMKRLSGSGVLQGYASVTLPALTFGILDPDECVLIVGTVSLLSSILAVYTAAIFNRRNLVTVSCAIGGSAMGAVMIWFYLHEKTKIHVDDYSYVIFISFVFNYMTFNFGLGPIGASIKGEMFSANVRTLCSSLTTILVSLTSFFLNRFYLIIAKSLGMYLNYALFSFSCFFAIAFTWLCVPDTHGKTLKEIQEILSKKNKKSGVV